MELARKLGADTVTLFGFNVAATVIDYARRHNITRIIVGKTLRPRWQEYVFGSIVDQLIHDSGTIDVYVISSEEHAPQIAGEIEHLLPAVPPKDYLAALALVAAVVVIGWLIKSFISATNLAMLFLLAVVVIAFRRGLRPAIFTAIIGVLAFDFFFVSPYMTFRVSDSEYLITFAGMIIVGALVSLLVTRAREHAFAAQSREKETGTLYALSQDLAVAPDAGSVIAAVTRHIREIFQWESVVLLPEGDGLAVQMFESGIVLNDDDIAVATWAFQHSTVAGYDTDTLHGSRLRYIPLIGAAGVLGILGVKPADAEGIVTHEQERILMAFASQMALALERVRLTKNNP
jgi:two-component system sensor histidine kinase KdpD